MCPKYEPLLSPMTSYFQNGRLIKKKNKSYLLKDTFLSDFGNTVFYNVGPDFSKKVVLNFHHLVCYGVHFWAPSLRNYRFESPPSALNMTLPAFVGSLFLT